MWFLVFYVERILPAIPPPELAEGQMGTSSSFSSVEGMIICRTVLLFRLKLNFEFPQNPLDLFGFAFWKIKRFLADFPHHFFGFCHGCGLLFWFLSGAELLPINWKIAGGGYLSTGFYKKV
jgi:hypothetical protein